MFLGLEGVLLDFNTVNSTDDDCTLESPIHSSDSLLDLQILKDCGEDISVEFIFNDYRYLYVTSDPHIINRWETFETDLNITMSPLWQVCGLKEDPDCFIKVKVNGLELPGVLVRIDYKKNEGR